MALAPVTRALAAALILAATAAQAAEPPEAQADSYFPASYVASRTAFRAACAAPRTPQPVCAAVPIHYPAIPDQDLTIDTALIAAGHPNLLIVQSGIHGAEAPAGAAVQHMIWQTHLDRLLAAGWDVLLIHALNPYGFKYGRRVDGENVDLNRNFFATPDPVTFGPRNAAYDVLRGLVEPTERIASVEWQNAMVTARTLLGFARHGFDFAYVSNGTHGGQYADPNGFEFGGNHAAQQTAFWRAAVAPVMAAHAGHIVMLDLHTGLGAANVLSVYSGNTWPAPRLAAMRDFVGGIGHPGIRFQAPVESSYQTTGDVIDFVPTLVPDGRTTAVTLEWGTLGESLSASIASNNRMVLEHQAHFQGCTTEAACAAIRRSFAELFNPPDDAFRRAVIGQADAYLTRIEANGHP